MAEKSGGGVNWWRKALMTMGLKGSMRDSSQSLSLLDPTGWGKLFPGTYTGKAVDETSAMQYSVLWACVKILSESVGMLPKGIYRKESNGNAVKDDDHPLADVLIHAPNADMTAQEFFEAGQTNLGQCGNAYHLIERNGAGNVSSLYPIVGANCVPERNRETGRVQYKVLDRGQWEVLPREKIWHVKGFGSTGLIGYSPIGAARQGIGLGLASEEFQARFFGQGARPSAIAEIPQWLNDKQRPIARENINRMLGGLENAHRVHILEGGMKLTPWGFPLDDLQFVELRRFQLHEICRIYRVPPHMVADLERATFSNIEQMSLEFVQFTLLPWLTRWERSAERWLLKPGERNKFMVRFNFEGLLRADTAGRAEYLRIMTANGIMSHNEARAKDNMNRVEAAGMDDYTVQSNMVAIDDLQKIAEGMTSNQPAQKKERDAGSIYVVSPQAAAPEVKVNVTGPQIDMPDPVKLELVKHLSTMTDAAKLTLAHTRSAGNEAEQRDQKMQQTLQDGLKAIQQAVLKPRKPVLNEAGDIIASVAVDQL